MATQTDIVSLTDMVIKNNQAILALSNAAEDAAIKEFMKEISRSDQRSDINSLAYNSRPKSDVEDQNSSV